MKHRIQLGTIAVLAAGFVLAVASGCASGVTRPASSAPAAAFRASESRKLSQVTVSLTPGAREKLKDNLKFDAEQLRKQVERALDASALLDATQKEQEPSIEIVVTNMRVRSNFSAVMWGAMAGADGIHGEIVVWSPTHQELDRFKVSTTYALGGVAGGMDSTRMDWLYEAFAKETLKELTGKNSQTARTR